MKIKLPPLIHNFIGVMEGDVGPEVLPKSNSFLVASLGFFALVEFGVRLLTHSAIGAVGIGVSATVFLIIVAAISARLLGRNERLVQTLIALALAGAIVALVNFVCRTFLKVGFHLMLEDEAPVESITNFLLFPIFLWNIIVYAVIFRRAFPIGTLLAFGLSFSCVLMLFFEIPHFFK
ncbi:hypothetical protein [Methylocapsa aurea]|uniref:hypothetical protein n=1 Tax=Methylocapsa aurea TaxID=663610 RepID=UPI00055B3154|nr:hypothetical protein [Methylocapsa aurea]